MPIEIFDEKNIEDDFQIQKFPLNILLRFGLSSNQTRVYLFLSKSGMKTASQVSKMLKIPRTETYAIFKRLQQRGCVEIKNGRPWKFQAVPIERYFERKIQSEYKKIQELEEMLEVIRKLKFNQIAVSQYKLFN